VLPQNRVFDIQFKNIKSGEITVKKNGETLEIKKKYGDCARVELAFEPYAEYEICVQFQEKTEMEKRTERAFEVLLRTEGENMVKMALYLALQKAQTVEEYIQIVEKETRLSAGARGRLKENL
jgi:hypothetical protein